MSAIVADLEVLAACERVAGGRYDAPASAFVTWLVGQREGWPEARKRVSKSAWYRDLRLLKKAGIDVMRSNSRTPYGSSIPRSLHILRQSRSLSSE
jgi:hypothetical protein